MFESLIDLDIRLFQFLNQSGIPFFDPIMRFLSSIWIWIPVFVFILIEQIRKKGVSAWIGLLFIVVLYTASDQVSNHLFKDIIQRLRPCHDPDLIEQLRLVAKQCGGLYGFVSSHASNSFVIAVFSMLLIRRRWYTITILTWATLVSYSRIYLGVHFPGDVIGGILLGSSLAGLGHYIHLKIDRSRYENQKS